MDDTDPGEWFTPKPFTMEVEFTDVDPDVLGLLTGGRMGTPLSPDPTFAVETTVFVPVRRRAWRVVWEFLRRTPRKYHQHYYYIPHARVSRNTTGD